MFSVFSCPLAPSPLHSDLVVPSMIVAYLKFISSPDSLDQSLFSLFLGLNCEEETTLSAISHFAEPACECISTSPVYWAPTGPMSLHQETTREWKDVVSALRDSWVRDRSSARHMYGITINRYPENKTLFPQKHCVTLAFNAVRGAKNKPLAVLSHGKG